MIENIMHLGFSEKEAAVYLYIVEYGSSAASEIARKLHYPKSTVNFLAESLWKRGFLIKSIQKNIHYYDVDLGFLDTRISREIEQKYQFLHTSLPLLQEMRKNIIMKPKIYFFDGEEQCRLAYLDILTTRDRFYEFGAHGDLVGAFGTEFMDQFIEMRKKKGIFCESIGSDGHTEQKLKAKDREDLRNLTLYGSEYGVIGSSIAIYEDRVLILNLKNGHSGVRIENQAFAESMRTIYRIAKG